MPGKINTRANEKLNQNLTAKVFRNFIENPTPNFDEDASALRI